MRERRGDEPRRVAEGDLVMTGDVARPETHRHRRRDFAPSPLATIRERLAHRVRLGEANAATLRALELLGGAA
jgi:hypothetical protein